jgi:two-component system chemotaxis response regulator CheB
MTANVDLICDTDNAKLKTIVAIGASTGGPKALERVLSSLPQDIPAAFLVVQHMPAGFTKSFSERLNKLSELMVKEAENGDIVQAFFCVCLLPFQERYL